MIYNLLINYLIFIDKYFPQKLASNTLYTYICTTIIQTGYAKVAQLVERDLAKVEVAGSNPVFRSEKKAPETVLFFSLVPKPGICRGGGTGRHAGLKIL